MSGSDTSTSGIIDASLYLYQNLANGKFAMIVNIMIGMVVAYIAMKILLSFLHK